MEMNIPKLRFRKDDGTHYPKWQEKKIKDFSQRIGDGLHGTPIYDLNSDYHFVNGNNIKNGKLVLYNSDKRVSPAIAKKNDKDLDSDTILISLNGTIGNISIYENQKVMLGKSIGYIKTKDINRVFLMYLLSSNTVQTKFSKSVTGTTIKNLGLAEIREMKVTMPSLSEQYKIADFFSTIDSRITNQSNKVVSLTELKKGIMQKLFSQEIRFKREDGEEYPKWEEKIMGEIFDQIESGMTAEQVTEPTEYPVSRIETISDDKININKVGYVKYFNGIERYKLMKGDILFSNINSLKFIGRAVLVENVELYHGMNLLKLRVKDGFSSNFLIYSFNTEKMTNQFKSNAKRAVNQASISQSDIKRLVIKIPIIQEQQKIADFLSTLDSKIDIETQILSTLQTVKKGLLQQMFV